MDEGGLDGSFFRIGSAQPEGRGNTVGADERDVGPYAPGGFDGGLADGGLGQAADLAAEQVQGDAGFAGQPRRDGQCMGDDHQFGVGRGSGGRGSGGGRAGSEQLRQGLGGGAG